MITIFPIGAKVTVRGTRHDGMTGTVRAYTRLGVDNAHIVDFDAPTMKNVFDRDGNIVSTEPVSGPYGEFLPEELSLT